MICSSQVKTSQDHHNTPLTHPSSVCVSPSPTRWTSHAPALPALSALASLLSLWSCVLPAAPSRAELLAHDGMDVLLTALAQGNASLRCVG